MNQIRSGSNGKSIHYDYTVDERYRNFFSKEKRLFVEYDTEVRNVPYSIAIIPFLANIMPLAWFLGMDVRVDEVDSAFLSCLDDIKAELSKEWKHKRLSGNIVANNTVKNSVRGGKRLVLFSGGLDSLVTFLRHREENPDIMTIHGADIPIDDTEQWASVLRFIESTELLENVRKIRVKSNVREFYTYRADVLVDIGWWAKVQHGLALLGVNAPLTYVNGYDRIYLASSVVNDFAWGSHPALDDKVRWANVSCRNDASEMSRQDKIDFIVETIRKTGRALRIRVCYSELNHGLNCNSCEKCYRTILGIILAGDDPNLYGFSVAGDIYGKVFEHFRRNIHSDPGMILLWEDIAKKAMSGSKPFIFGDRTEELSAIQRIASGEIVNHLRSGLQKGTKLRVLKFVLRNRFNRLYRLYRRSMASQLSVGNLR